MKNITAKMKQIQELKIKQHKPAKDVVELTEEELTDIQEFLKRYDDFILASADTSRAIEADGFHPSILGVAYGNCSRYAVYLLRGERKEPIHNARTLRIFALGNAIHEQVQGTIAGMVEAGLIKSFDSEVAIDTEDPPVKGHCDGIITLWNDRKILLEIKSANDEVFLNRRKWKREKPEHFAQGNIYGYLKDIPTAWVFYYNKNNSELEIFERKIDGAAAEKQLKKWRKIYAAYEDGKLPVRPYKPDSKACTYCNLRELCLNDSDQGVKI